MIETKVYDVLRDLCNGNVFPLIAQEKAVAPYIVYTPVSDVKSDVFCGLAESKDTIQVDGYHPVYDEMLILKQDILNRIEILPIFNVNCTQSYESDTKLYRIMIEFSIIQ